MSGISKRDLSQIMSYEFRLGHCVAVAHANITKIYGPHSVSKSNLSRCFKRFGQGDFSFGQQSDHNGKGPVYGKKVGKAVNVETKSLVKSIATKSKLPKRTEKHLGENGKTKKCEKQGAKRMPAKKGTRKIPQNMKHKCAAKNNEEEAAEKRKKKLVSKNEEVSEVEKTEEAANSSTAQPEKSEGSSVQESSSSTTESRKGRGTKRKIAADEEEGTKRAVPHGKKFKLALTLEQFLPKEKGDRVLSCGEGEQLGHPGRTTTKKPRAIDTLPVDKKIVQVVAGGVHSLVLLDDGSVYSCGINEKGTVPAEGVEPEDSTDKFAVIKFEENIEKEGKLVMLAAGASFSAALTDKGSVIAWGNLRDSSGSLENHKVLRNMEQSPVVIVHHGAHQIVKIAAGENHLVMLSSAGELLTFGDGSLGQLGRSARAKLIRSQYMVDDKGTNLRVTVTEKGKIIYFDDIMAGGYWTAARATDGRIFVCGLNNFAQLGIPTPEADPKAEEGKEEPELRIMHLTVSPAFEQGKIMQLCGLQHIIALDMDGQIYGIGKNTDNALGLGNWTGKDDQEHWKYDKLQKINMASKVAGITAKLGCSIAWDEDGKGYSWGCDTSGQLGLGIKDDDDKVVGQPKLITSAHLEGYKIISVSIADNHALFLAKSS